MKKPHKLLAIIVFALMPMMLSSCDTFLSALISTDATRSVNGVTSKEAKAEKVAKTKEVLENY